MTRPPLALRFLAALGGAAMMAAATVFTLGTVLGAPLGMAIASAWSRRRGAHLSRPAWWGSAVGGSATVALLLVTIAFSFAPPGIMDSAREAAVAEQERARTQPTRIEQALERFQHRNAATEAMERRTDAMVESETFLWLVAILTMAIGCVIVGLVSGSVGWAASMLLVYGVRGRASPPVA